MDRFLKLYSFNYILVIVYLLIIMYLIQQYPDGQQKVGPRSIIV